MSGHTALIKSRRFLPLFITQFCGAFNDNILRTALLIWFTYSVESFVDIKVVNLILVAAALFILPFFLFASIAGQVADKYEQSQLTRILKVSELVLVTLCALCLYFKIVYGLLFLLFCMGTQSTFFGPIKYSLLPEHLGVRELVRANGLLKTGTFIAILCGTICGGVILTIPRGLELLSLIMIIMALIGLFGSIFILETKANDPDLKISFNIVTQTWRVMGYAYRNYEVFLCIISISWFWLVGATFLSQLPSYTKNIIGGNEHVVTMFLVLFAVGIGAGSMLCDKLLKGEVSIRLIPYGAIGISIFIIDLYISSASYHALLSGCSGNNCINNVASFFSQSIYSWRIVFDFLFMSISAGIYIVPLYAIVQYYSNKQYLSRIISVNNVMNALFMLLAKLTVFILFYLQFEIHHIMLLLGIGNILVFVLIRMLMGKDYGHFNIS